MSMNVLKEPQRLGYIAWSFVAAYTMKFLADIAHEFIGHGSFVLLFGGRISGSYISPWWPVSLSHISYMDLPSIGYAGDIVTAAGPVVSLLLLWIMLGVARHLISRGHIFISNAALWLSFWAFCNIDGYLILGPIGRFGDIGYLMDSWHLPEWPFLIAGVGLFVLYVRLLISSIDQYSQILTGLSGHRSLFIEHFLGPGLLILAISIVFGINDPNAYYQFSDLLP